VINSAFEGDQDMPESPTPKPARPWRVVAEEASHEYDPVKMSELMQELNRALEEQGITKSSGVPERKLA